MPPTELDADPHQGFFSTSDPRQNKQVLCPITVAPQMGQVLAATKVMKGNKSLPQILGSRQLKRGHHLKKVINVSLSDESGASALCTSSSRMPVTKSFLQSHHNKTKSASN